MSANITNDFAFLFFLIVIGLCSNCNAVQQQYTGNDMLDCNSENVSSVRGYVCGGGGGDASCLSYLYFRSTAPYTTPVAIAYLLGASAENISLLNSIPDVSTVPSGRPVLVPVTCTCTSAGKDLPRYYQHDARYTLKWDPENYYTIANETYQGLTTCQAMAAQNPLHKMLNLSVGDRFKAPIRCACPDRTQLAAGFRYILTYVVTWGDNITTIADCFESDADAILKANGLKEIDLIYPFTTLLVPLRKELTSDVLKACGSLAPPLAPPAPPPPAVLADLPRSSGRSSKKWFGTGIGLGAGVITVFLAAAAGVTWIILLLTRSKRRTGRDAVEHSNGLYRHTEQGSYSPESEMIKEARLATTLSSLVVYPYKDLQEATGFFAETHRISGSVYRGIFNGDLAAVKQMQGVDVSEQVTNLKQLNHTSLIRISGFCVHEGNTYLVFEYAQNGSLADWLHGVVKPCPLSWKRRVQVAYDVADGLNYLHNYTSPAFVHKDLRSSNVLLDGEFRAKLSNFGLARALPQDDGTVGGRQLTKHVVGTQGYMPPEYLLHGLVTPKMDIFALGVLMLELLSGREAVMEAAMEDDNGGQRMGLLWEEIGLVMTGDDVMEKLTEFIDAKLQTGGEQFPSDAAIAMAQLARRCVAREPSNRPTATEALMALSAMQSASLDWEPWSGCRESNSLVQGR